MGWKKRFLNRFKKSPRLRRIHTVFQHAIREICYDYNDATTMQAHAAPKWHREETPYYDESMQPFHQTLQLLQIMPEKMQHLVAIESSSLNTTQNMYEKISEDFATSQQPQRGTEPDSVNVPVSTTNQQACSLATSNEHLEFAETRAVLRKSDASPVKNQGSNVILPKRRPQLNLQTDLADLTDFKERIGIVPCRSSVTRVQSLKEGLNQYHCNLNRTHSYSTGLEKTDEDVIRRAPSFEESVNRLRQSKTEMKTSDLDPGKKVKNRPTVAAITHLFDNSKVLDYGHPPEHSYENLNHYENLNESALYDEPRKIDIQLYETIRSQKLEVHYENVTAEPTYMNVSCDDDTNLYENMQKENKGIEYDVPRTATHIYDSPRKKEVSPSEYDVPRLSTNQCLVPQASQLLLESQRSQECDRDSLDGDQHPDIPSPDYGSEEEGETSNCLVSDSVDEGLESDARSYFNDEQGLEVIIEEPEEEEEDLVSDQGKGSLEESEGIGSGESHSSEEDSGSSGIHSDGCLSPAVNPDTLKKDQGEERDRVIEVYPETVRQRKATNKHQNKVDITKLDKIKRPPQKEEESQTKVKKFLPSVKALRSQFESKPSMDSNKVAQAIQSPTIEVTSHQVALKEPSNNNSSITKTSNKENNSPIDEPIQSIIEQFGEVDKELMKPKLTTATWDPSHLLSSLYAVPVPDATNSQSNSSFINLEGWLEKLPSGRRKATFWNAWKRRYFRLKDGHLSYFTNSHSEKPSMTLQLLGGRIDSMDNTMLGIDDANHLVETMIGIDDRKGHYIVVRCGSKDSTERWKKALQSHTVEDYRSAYIQPWPIPRDPRMLQNIIVIDLGSHSVRAGILASQPTLPHIFFPSVMAVHKDTGKAEFGVDALLPNVRQHSYLSWPVRPSQKITKFSVDLSGVAGLLRKAFMLLSVDPRHYSVQLVAARAFSPVTLAEITRILIEKFGVAAVNVSHQAVLTLWAYNATTGIAVDIGERIDVVPITDGYVVEGGVSRVPYGGARMVDHLRHFLLQKHYSMMTEVESYFVHYILENMCYCASNYNSELNKFKTNPASFESSLPIHNFFTEKPVWNQVKLDAGRFQATEGLFNPNAWGLDNSGIHRLVHKAIQECGVDVRRELSRSIFVSGGVTMLPGFCERLQADLTRLTPALSPKVHASPYRYHAAYLGACQLANSPGFNQSKVSREEWSQTGPQCVTKWSLL